MFRNMMIASLLGLTMLLANSKVMAQAVVASTDLYFVPYVEFTDTNVGFTMSQNAKLVGINIVLTGSTGGDICSSMIETLDPASGAIKRYAEARLSDTGTTSHFIPIHGIVIPAGVAVKPLGDCPATAYFHFLRAPVISKIGSVISN